MMGSEDAISMSNYSKTVKCRSVVAEALVINSYDFVSRINVYQDTWNYMKERSRAKEIYIADQYSFT